MNYLAYNLRVNLKGVLGMATALILCLHFADMGMTVVALRKANIYETNPLPAFGFGHIGIGVWMAVTQILLIALLTYFLAMPRRMGMFFLGLVLIEQLIVVASNFSALLWGHALVVL